MPVELFVLYNVVQMYTMTRHSLIIPVQCLYKSYWSRGFLTLVGGVHVNFSLNKLQVTEWTWFHIQPGVSEVNFYIIIYFIVEMILRYAKYSRELLNVCTEAALYEFLSCQKKFLCTCKTFRNCNLQWKEMSLHSTIYQSCFSVFFVYNIKEYTFLN